MGNTLKISESLTLEPLFFYFFLETTSEGLISSEDESSSFISSVI